MILNKLDFGMITIAAFKMSYQRSACRPGVTIVGGDTIEIILALRTPRHIGAAIGFNGVYPNVHGERGLHSAKFFTRSGFLNPSKVSQRHGDSQLVETLEKNMTHACDGFPSQVDMAVHLSDCPAVRKSGVVPKFDFGPQMTRQAKESPCYLRRENTLCESWQTSPPTDFVTI
ncbi:predicted protein [Histoplasma capsulatum H143]|uniref:Uncharacterized protein n=1 Tax=Ajellomyces capsulatus (strain H143) TaxID=544712 RepID=C6HLX4_AJECH|nr:predicted protein [Histoplasma capsulatum H143]